MRLVHVRPLPILLLLLYSVPATGGAPPAPPNEAQVRAVAAERFGPAARVHWSSSRRAAAGLFGLSVPAPAALDVEDGARTFLAANGDLLGGLGQTDLGPARVDRTGPFTVVRFGLVAGELPVEARSVAVRLDQDGRVRGVQSDFSRLRVAPISGDVGPDRARHAASSRLGGAPAGTPTRVVLAVSPLSAHVAYRVPVTRFPLLLHYYVWVSAEDGSVLRTAPAIADQPREVSP